MLMAYDINIREEELKNKIANDYFWLYDNTRIIGNVDFCVSMHKSGSQINEQESLLWAEAKKGISDIYKSVTQLILTIGKARTFDKYLPPLMLGAFDSEKIAFIQYNDIQDVFYQNDFNWNVTPSNYETKEFKIVLEKVQFVFNKNTRLYYYGKDERELHKFIKANFIVGKWGITKNRIDKTNFIVIYNKWLQEVKPSIAANWDIAKKKGVIDGDFYLADLLSEDNITLKDKLFVVLKSIRYELNRHLDEWGAFTSSSVEFNDGQKAHNLFWNKYERPPKEEYWDYIVERRDLLVPQDVRERKGSFFTPQIWVELSQKYLTDALGLDWQDEYYIWDCASGTGNLLNGLTNKYNIWASTLDKQDVDVMKDRIRNGANLLEDHVFQFDFLNDDFTKLPKPLQDIINNPAKRKKLVVYINPPYAESNGRVSLNRSNIQLTSIYSIYKSKMGSVAAELYAQFLFRIYFQIPDCLIAQFSKFKIISSSNSSVFRSNFLADIKSCFVVPGNTFDNVKGKFPIGFFIWDTSRKDKFEEIPADIYLEDGIYQKRKTFYTYDNIKGKINDWINQIKCNKTNDILGVLIADAPDFQHNKSVCIASKRSAGHFVYIPVCSDNLILASIYIAVRHCTEATWLNDREQFLFPNNGWIGDIEFQHDCLAYTLFHGQNRISSAEGTNHWIPFTESEVNAHEKFESNFMSKFIRGKIKPADETPNIFSALSEPKAHYEVPLVFSPEANAVFEAGKKLWTYYHAQPACNVNASL